MTEMATGKATIEVSWDGNGDVPDLLQHTLNRLMSEMCALDDVWDPAINVTLDGAKFDMQREEREARDLPDTDEVLRDD